MANDSAQRFQVDLGGIIQVLSSHLYSTPTVAFRELLQNSTDAISARKLLDPVHQGRIQVELIESGAVPTLVLEDNGIGLTEDEIHLFLATIGGSSKRDQDQGAREQFIGQFGIGLLSCFVLSDEIVAITRSATHPDCPSVEWRGSDQGTYSVRVLEKQGPVGTTIYLRIKEDYASLCTPHQLRTWLVHYGEFLGLPIELLSRGISIRLDTPNLPWRSTKRAQMDEQEQWDLGSRFFSEEFIDMFPVRSAAGGVEGMAYVSGQSRSLQTKPQHRLYMKGMLLSDHVEGLTPAWAVFVKIVANADKLHPTASRESLMEDDTLTATCEQIGDCIKAYMRRLSGSDPDKLGLIIGTHHLALKSLALEDDDFLRFVAPWFEFETSRGRLKFSEILQQPEPHYCTAIARFRQLAPVAAAEGRCLINAGYVFDADLMNALAVEFPDAGLEAVSAMDFSEQLGEVSAEESHRFEQLLETAGQTLKEHQCRVEIRSFSPSSLPVLYIQNEGGHTSRALEQSKENEDDFFSALMEDISGRIAQDAFNVCYLNAANPLIQQISTVQDQGRLPIIVEVLYLQALLLGHYPMTAKETQLLSVRLMQLIQFGLSPQA